MLRLGEFIEGHPDIISVGTFFVRTHLLLDEKGAVLIDSGFVGDVRRIRRALAAKGLNWGDLRAILLTHGHLDHTLNARRLQELSGAPVFMHPRDTEHLLGKYPYKGINHVCGALEWTGRVGFRYKPPNDVRPLEDGQVLECGLKVVHIPGHTVGHCGFLHLESGYFFNGDAIVNGPFGVGLPPRIFSSQPWLHWRTIQRILDLKPKGLLSNHSDGAPPEVQLRRLLRVVRKATMTRARTRV